MMTKLLSMVKYWVVAVQPYNFEVIHKLGREEMGHADGLSRQTEQGQAQDQNHNQDKEEHDNKESSA